MAWLDLGLLSEIHVTVALTLFGALALYGTLAAPNQGLQRQHAFARHRKVKRPTAE
jgi:hypothetical protein